MVRAAVDPLCQVLGHRVGRQPEHRAVLHIVARHLAGEAAVGLMDHRADPGARDNGAVRVAAHHLRRHDLLHAHHHPLRGPEPPPGVRVHPPGLDIAVLVGPLGVPQRDAGLQRGQRDDGLSGIRVLDDP